MENKSENQEVEVERKKKVKRRVFSLNNGMKRKIGIQCEM